MDTFVMVMQLLLSLSILVILHELGHFIPAKLFKTRVEKFYLFFNPWFSLFKYKKGDTEYGIGWLPLGGYVKISGMIDESMDLDQLKKEPQPWEFRSKPVWQRFIIMFGGVLVNFILALVIYSMVSYTWGKDYVKNDDLTYGIHILDDNLLGDNLFQQGDKFVTIGGEEIDDIDEIVSRVLIDQSRDFTVNRNGEIINIKIGDEAIDYMLKKERPFFMPRYLTKIGYISDSSIATRVGLQLDDEILELNGRSTIYFDEFLSAAKELKKARVDSAKLTVRRNNEILHFTEKFDTTYRIGFVFKRKDVFKITHLDYTFAESIPAGIKLGTNKLANYVKQFRLIFTKKEAAKKVGGYGTIAQMFKGGWNWKRFWKNTAFLSIALAFMNILPIPALDGGHILFLIYEMISGKPPSEKFLEKAQVFGFLIIISLLLLVNGREFINAIMK